MCWYAYEPAAGDDVWQVPPGTPFDALPPDWRCPRCDAPKEKFLALPLPAQRGERRGEGPTTVDPRVALLEAAYRHIHATKMADVPILNPRLRVEAVAFQPFDGGLFGALVTPWSVNAVFFPPPGPPSPELGRARALPSGVFTFLPQRLEGLGVVELSSIFSPALEFESHEAAVATAAEAVRLLLSPEAPRQADAGARAEPPAALPAAPSRRALLTLFTARRSS